MPDIDSLEKYFDILLSNSSDAGADHNFADDTKRFALYKIITSDFGKIGGNLNNIGNNLEKTYPDYIDIVKDLAKSFSDLAQINDQDLDYYIRTLAIERLIYKKSQSGELTEEMLGYLIEGLMQLFIEDGEELLQSTKKTLLLIKNKKRKSIFFKKKYEDELREYIADTLDIYEGIEGNLRNAKAGIVAKDQKMIKILREIRAGMKNHVMHEAMQLANIKAEENKNIKKILSGRGKDSEGVSR